MRKRKCRVEVYLTEAELEALNHKVRRTGMSREGYLRSIISGTVPMERPAAEMLDVLKELRQINNNMNQVAAKANSVGTIDGERYRENADALQDVINTIMGRLFS